MILEIIIVSLIGGDDLAMKLEIIIVPLIGDDIGDNHSIFNWR